MLIEQIVGNVATLEKKAPHIEKVYLESDHLLKRVQRVVTDHGKELGIRLKDNRELVDGDVLYMDEKNMIVIQVIADDLLTIQPTSIKQMGRLLISLETGICQLNLKKTKCLFNMII